MKKNYTLKELKNPASAWLLLVILSLLITAAIAPMAVWISIEKSEIFFSARQLQGELDNKLELFAKLEVEHERLLSPHELQRKAEAIHMGVAKSGQIRRLDLTADIAPPVNTSPLTQ